MPSAHYAGFQSDYRPAGRWDRAASTLVVAAVAIVVGAVAGGASVFTIVSVLSGDHRQEDRKQDRKEDRIAARNQSEPAAPAAAAATMPRQGQPEPKSATTPDAHPASEATAAIPPAATAAAPAPESGVAPKSPSAQGSAPAETEMSSPTRSAAALRGASESATDNRHGKRARRSREYRFDSDRRPASTGTDRTAVAPDGRSTRRAETEKPTSEHGVAPSSAAPSATASASNGSTSAAEQHGPYWDYFGNARSRTSREPRHVTAPQHTAPQQATAPHEANTPQQPAAQQPLQGGEASAAAATAGAAGQEAEGRQPNDIAKKNRAGSSSAARRSRPDSQHAARQEGAPAVSHRRLVIIPQPADAWSEREPWGYRERWGGGFFGRDNWRDYWN